MCCLNFSTHDMKIKSKIVVVRTKFVQILMKLISNVNYQDEKLSRHPVLVQKQTKNCSSLSCNTCFWGFYALCLVVVT